VTIWEHLPNRYYFCTIIKQEKEKNGDNLGSWTNNRKLPFFASFLLDGKYRSFLLNGISKNKLELSK